MNLKIAPSHKSLLLALSALLFIGCQSKDEKFISEMTVQLEKAKSLACKAFELETENRKVLSDHSDITFKLSDEFENEPSDEFKAEAVAYGISSDFDWEDQLWTVKIVTELNQVMTDKQSSIQAELGPIAAELALLEAETTEMAAEFKRSSGYLLEDGKSSGPEEDIFKAKLQAAAVLVESKECP